ncbi:hypothetical protein V5O48_006696 [Marasmius crinis-equi]|uniref:Uncharacterized protein n=1 Tax=Marasmius crinis-equi TaxID=585013 RepID=A0ABR3F671_9AGAR
MATNVSGTIIIGYKVWCYRQNVGAFLGKCRQKTRAEKVLVLFLESGIVYSVLWVIQLAVVLMDAPKSFSGKVVQQIFTSASIQLVGIYPTLLIVLVYLQCSMWDPSGTFSTMRSTPTAAYDSSGSRSALVSKVDMA